MKDLIEKLSVLEQLPAGKNLVEKQLQDIEQYLLTHVCLDFGNNVIVYPKEIEAYYYNEYNYVDSSVHRNVLQCYRFGQLYFHRITETEEGNINESRSGFDVCLSRNNDYWFGILIRSAVIKVGKKKGELIVGPNNLMKALRKALNKDHRQIEAMTDILRECNNPAPFIFIGPRIGIETNEMLRMIAEFSLKDKGYPSAESLFVHYIKTHNLLKSPYDMPLVEELAIEILGYVPRKSLQLL